MTHNTRREDQLPVPGGNDENNIPSDEAYRAMLRDLAASKDEIWASIQQQVEELERILAQYNPFDVIGNILFANAVFDAETYKEYAHEGSDAYIEYVTLLLLTKPYDTYAERALVPIPVNDIQQRIRAIFDTMKPFLIVKDLDPERSASPNSLMQLQYRIVTDSLFVRYSSYHHHLCDILRDLFTPLQSELEKIIGFTVQDALALIEGIESLMLQRLLERHEKATQSEEEVRSYIHEQSPLLSLDELNHKAQDMMKLWVCFALGDTISFTSQELAEETQIDVGRVQAFLERLSLSFGEVDPTYYRSPAATHPLMTKPFVRHAEYYLRPVKDLSYWSLRPAIEVLLNPDNAGAVNHSQTLWARYDAIRADYVEKKAIEYLSNALHPGRSYRSLKYWVTEHGQRKEAELDGLLVIDSTLFLVEAKAGSVTQPARRGASASLKTDLQKLVGDAYSQALRAKKYIQETDQPTFSLSDGSTVQVPKERIARIFLVSVTLDALDAFATNISQFQDFGFFEESDFPWVVSLTDLRVISELVEFPSQFVHYLIRRLRINEHGRAQTYDELDWFGTYLQNGLYFEDMLDEQDAPDMIYVQPATTHFDDYYFYLTGQRKTPVSKPTQPMPELMRQMLTELEVHRPSRYLEIACALLDMSFTTREDFIKTFLQQRERALQDQLLHDFTFRFEHEDTYITCMFAPAKRTHELKRRLAAYCPLKKYQMKSNLWIGLACIADGPDVLQGCIVLHSPWEYDAEIERRVAGSFPAAEKQ